jgi:3'-phosphoadenosine 5'-phosphosulfate sulfotransferase (PAPS reductase)/FAD synthetase
MKWRELEQEQSCSLDHKINIARGVIQAAFNLSHCPALAFSAGKDSTVLRDLIRRFFPEEFKRLILIWGNTGVEYPECVSFARKIAKEQDPGTFFEARPGKTETEGYKYSGQRRIWQYLVETERIGEVLKPDGKLKTTSCLEKACPPHIRKQLETENLVWKAGSHMTYWWCIDQYGFPLLGKSWSKLSARRINIDTFLKFSQSVSVDPILLKYYQILRQVKISQHCCTILKKEPSERVQSELGVDLIFKGLMAHESRSRAKNFLTRGYLFEGKSRDYLHGAPFFHCQPMAIWTDNDVWEYIHRYQVEYSQLYDMTYISQDGSKQHIKRNGCLGCATDFGFANNHLAILRQTHPAAWRAVMKTGMAREIRKLQHALRACQMDIFDLVSDEELIEMQPCVFDDLDGLSGKQELKELIYDPEL